MVHAVGPQGKQPLSAHELDGRLRTTPQIHGFGSARGNADSGQNHLGAGLTPNYDKSASASPSAPKKLPVSSPHLLHQAALPAQEYGRFLTNKFGLAPIKIEDNSGVMRQPPGVISPTPMTAYFDAEEHEWGGKGADESDVTFAAAQSLNDTTSAASTLGSFAPIEQAALDESQETAEETAGSSSIASETDTPGPMTPATPGWRPRELTLLRSRGRNGSGGKALNSGGHLIRAESESSGDGEREKNRFIEGLGIRGLPGEHRGSRSTPARDVLPIASLTSPASANASPSTGNSSFPATGPGTHPVPPMPRELKLSPSPALPNAKWGRVSPSSFAARSRLPVRHGPAFSTPSLNASLDGQVASPSNPGLEVTEQVPIDPAVGSADERIFLESGSKPARGPASAPHSQEQSITRRPSLSFVESANSTKSRRKAAPAPLVLRSDTSSSSQSGSARGYDQSTSSASLQHAASVASANSEASGNDPGLSPQMARRSGRSTSRSSSALPPKGQAKDQSEQHQNPPPPSPDTSTSDMGTPGNALDATFSTPLLIPTPLLQGAASWESEQKEKLQRKNSSLSISSTAQDNNMQANYSEGPSRVVHASGERSSHDQLKKRASTKEDSDAPLPAPAPALDVDGDSPATHGADAHINASRRDTLSGDSVGAFEYEVSDNSNKTSVRDSATSQSSLAEPKPYKIRAAENTSISIPAEASNVYDTESATPNLAQPMFNTNIFTQQQPPLAQREAQLRRDIMVDPREPLRQPVPGHHVRPDQTIRASSRTLPKLAAIRTLHDARLDGAVGTEGAPSHQVSGEHSSNSKRVSAESLHASQVLHSTSRSASHSPSERASFLSGSRPTSQAPRGRNIAVPDVPSFGFMGPVAREDSPGAAFYYMRDSTQASSPSQQQFSDEPQGMSRWSSGSEDETDRPLSSRAASRKGSKKGSNSKRSSNASVVIALSSNTAARKASTASSSNASFKKSGLFSGLGLRKKSFPSINTSTDFTMSSLGSSSLSTDSPVGGKVDILNEFPFPSQVQPGVSFGKPSGGGNRASNMAAPVMTSSPGQQSGHARAESLMSRSLNKIPGMSSPLDRSSPSSPMPRGRLGVQRSEASLRSVAASQSASSAASHAASSEFGSVDSASTSPLSAFVHTPDNAALKGLGMQGNSQKRGSVGLENAPLPKPRTSLKTHRSTDSLHSALTLTSNTHGNVDDNFRQLRQQYLRDSRQSHRQRSVTMDSPACDVGTAREFSSHRLAGGYARPSPPPVPVSRQSVKTLSSSTTRADVTTQHDISPDSLSPDDTPRIAYASLSSVGLDAKRQPASMAYDQASENHEGLSALGQAMIRKPHRRVRKVRSCARPHYTSLTDLGCEWQLRHPDQPFLSALGPALMDKVLAAVPCHTLHRSPNAGISHESDSRIDDYDSGNGNSTSGSRSQSRGRAGSGQGPEDREGQDGRDRRNNRAPFSLHHDDSQSDSDVDSTSSEDSYGASDNELPSVTLASTESRNEGASPSSDDAPLGQRLRLLHNSNGQSSKVRGKMPLASEVASAQLTAALDVGELEQRLGRLQRLQIQREKSPFVQQSKHDAPSQSQEFAIPKPQKVHRSTPSASVSSDRVDRSSKSASPHLAATSRHERAPSSEHEKPLPCILESAQRPSAGDVVAGFAHTVRARSRSRVGMRPTAIDVMRANPMPALPHAYPLRSLKADAPVSESTMSSPAEQQSAHMPASGPVLVEDQWKHAETLPTSRNPKGRERYRVYIGNRQNYVTVEISKLACIRDLLFAVQKKETLTTGDLSEGGWAVYDVCAGLGLERPLREYEILADVLQSRHEIHNDSFLIRRSGLSPYLTREAVPTTPPAIAGWVYVQDNGKKRSWTKRWLELRNHALFQSKTEKGKDAVLLCHLTSFDVYTAVAGEAWAAQAPKKYVFAMRSDNAVHLFEDPDKDYAFHLCLSDEKAARHWITSIMRAKTFVLRQEKAHLFGAPTAENLLSSRAHATAPVKPLLSFSGAQFEKGSLIEHQYQQSQSQSQTQSPDGSSAPWSAPFGAHAHALYDVPQSAGTLKLPPRESSAGGLGQYADPHRATTRADGPHQAQAERRSNMSARKPSPALGSDSPRHVLGQAHFESASTSMRGSKALSPRQ